MFTNSMTKMRKGRRSVIETCETNRTNPTRPDQTRPFQSFLTHLLQWPDATFHQLHPSEPGYSSCGFFVFHCRHPHFLAVGHSFLQQNCRFLFVVLLVDSLRRFFLFSWRTWPLVCPLLRMPPSCCHALPPTVLLFCGAVTKHWFRNSPGSHHGGGSRRGGYRPGRRTVGKLRAGPAFQKL